MNRLRRRAATTTAAVALAVAVAVTGPELAHAQSPTVILAQAASVDEVLNNLRNWR